MYRHCGTRALANARVILFGALFCGAALHSPSPLSAQDGLGERIGQSIDQGLNRLQGEIQEGWESLKQTVDRLGIEGRVYSRLRWDKEVATATLKVKSTDDGIVTLEGQVATIAAKKKAMKLADDTVGVTRVIDRLSISAQE